MTTTTKEQFLYIIKSLSYLRYIEPIKNQKVRISNADKRHIRYLFDAYRIGRLISFSDFIKLIKKQTYEFEQSPMTIAVNLIKGLKKEDKLNGE